jgi:hypothetical protein
MASQDYYFGQEWKNSPGAATVILWCVSNIQVSSHPGFCGNKAESDPRKIGTRRCGPSLFPLL